MGIDFFDRMWEAEQKEKERFGQRKNEIEDELFSQRRRIEELEKENAELKKNALVWHKVADGDYPPCEKGNYSINIFTDKGDIAYYNYDMGCWVAEPSSAEIDPPVAWCERPTFNKW